MTYSTEHRGHTITAQREGTNWVARSGTLVVTEETKHSSRKATVEQLKRKIDADLANVPEVDALLKRWATEIKDIISGLNPHDIAVATELIAVQASLAVSDALFRHSAAGVESKIAKLRRMAVPKGPARIES